MDRPHRAPFLSGRVLNGSLLLYSLSLAAILTEGHSIRICDKKKTLRRCVLHINIGCDTADSFHAATLEGFFISVSNKINLIPMLFEGHGKNTLFFDMVSKKNDGRVCLIK